jgi:hypothetical protein
LEPHEFIQSKSQVLNGRRLPRCRILKGGGSTRRHYLHILKKLIYGSRSRFGYNPEAHCLELKREGTLANPSQAHVEKARWKRGEGVENPSAPLKMQITTKD